MTVTPDDYRYVCRLVQDASAIDLREGREYLVQARLAPIARREGLETVTQLVARLRLGEPGLREDVVEAMATKETSFFRDMHPFDVLREQLVPDLLSAGPRRLHIWSAATATGQEAYSVAMLMHDHFSDAPAPAILGTDLSRQALEVARAGRYTSLEVNRGLPARLLVRHFDRDGLHWVLKEKVRRMVEFRQLNLSGPWPTMHPMDVVLLRNVLIYFDSAAKAAVLDKVAGVLRPGGFLILGGAETTYGIDDRFERVSIGRSLCYRLITRDGTAS
jgi:chemotaxis protein methyltransferase CheR